MDRSEVLNASLIRVPPVDAWAQVGQSGQPDQVRVGMLNGRPLYRFRSDRGPTLVFADNGQVLPKISSELAAQIASAWTDSRQALRRSMDR